MEELARLKRENGYHFAIEIDGGVTLDNIKMLADAGVEIAVAGSAVFKTEDPAEQAKKFKQI